ncbi:class I SAM-dependent methyltransferase [Candidatus Contendibacter odensensis]|uniref:Methyltransferase domain-containing protein n=1 Tax=Candidatus Contendobacter odensis Run_B_J11 TaxID=1400861 RepID=A0A7U7G7R3_9GAMM|nr:class I SAM-dependent methyltransferase [Candidatus Contendobacter odensis]CDH43065.1 hypothetical protein BN874_100018 [Candidatus Contendobacter odensis Run_B_J11]
MAERAHPDEAGFSSPWRFRLRRGIIPWLTYEHRPYLNEFKMRYKWVKKYCSGKDVLDIPCGMGWGTSSLTSAKACTGVDLSEEAIAEARQRYGNKLRFEIASMAALPFEDRSFDVVSCLEGIEHVPQDVGRKFIDEAFRILRSNGTLLISSPYCKNGKHSGNPYHVYEYKPDEITSLVENSFSIIDWFERDVDILTVRYIHAVPKTG